MKTELRILIVEDEQSILEMIKEAVIKVLEAYKDFITIDLDGAKIFKDALNKINNKYYDVIFLDHNLPESSEAERPQKVGYKLIQTIRERNEHTIIIGTSSQNEEIGDRFGKLDYSVTKNYSKEIGAQLSKIIEEFKKRN